MLVNCHPGTEEDVIAEIKQIPGVIEVNGMMGDFDVFVKVSADNPDIMETTVSKIRQIRIERSQTMPVLYGQGGSIDESE